MRALLVSSVCLLLASCSTFLGSRSGDPLAFDLSSLGPTEPRAEPQGADTKYGPMAGESLVQAGGSVTSIEQTPENGDSTTTTNVQLLGGIGWFPLQWLEIGGQVTGSWSLPDGGDDSVSVFGAPYANVNLRVARRFWLYAGPHAGVGYFKFGAEDATDLQYGGQAGARFWVQPRTSVFGEVRYTASSIEIGNSTIDLGTAQLLFGFTVVF